MIMALVTHYDMELHQMDVKTAFLNGELEEEIHMKQPQGFEEQGSEHMVCRLKKSIYGLKQASRQWYLKFDSVVTENGFVENPLDECIYFKVCGSRFIVLVLYVDDILLTSTDMKLLLEAKSFLSQSFEMKDLGEASFVLGIKITRDRKWGLLGISQESYIDKVLRRFSMENCSGGDLPMSKGDKLNKSQCPKNDFEKNAMKNKQYASLVGSLLYPQVCTRPDIAFAGSMLGRYQVNSGEVHWTEGKKVLRYLKKTRDYKLVYRKTESLDVVGYSDSYHAGDKDDFTSAFVFLMASGAISWSSSKQTKATLSTMQSEFIALSYATTHVVWLRDLIRCTQVVPSIEKPMPIFCDNSAAVFFVKNNKRSSSSKQIELKFLHVRKKTKEQKVVIEDIRTT
ncbi:hypothetical protein ACLB2K_007364 [Fragaria x ananassa]